jgi:uncharacterized protein (DUF2225 family)
MKDKKNEKKPRISFRQKNPTVCPVCGAEFYREEMLTGRGRLIAGKLTDELRRLYEKSPKYGIIYPLAYVLNVCPKCLYTAFPKDFSHLEPDELQRLKGSTVKRIRNLYTLFPGVDFNKDRNLFLGAASYVLCVDCYGLRNKGVAPTVKRAICALRAAWLLGDLYKEMPEYPYDKLRDFYYKKATLLYAKVVELAQTGKEPFDKALAILGPDVDKNYGYDGVLYVSGILGKKYGESIFKDKKKLLEFYENVKRSLSRLFGSGKSSKNKPSDLLYMTKDLYEEMGKRIEDLKKELGIEE